MNEEVKYCDQCGAKISSEAKFCSSCGCALDGSISPKVDATIKVVTTNATVEKGFKAVEKGIKATGKGLLSSLTSLDKSLENGVEATEKGIKATNKRLLFYLISLGRIIECVCRQMNVDQSCKFLRDTYLPEGVFL